MSAIIISTTAATFLLVNLTLLSPEVMATDRDNDYCSQTTEAAFRACRNDVADNFWEAQGICINISDNSDRNECYQDARQEKRESKALCNDQREAREEVCEAIGQDRYDP